MVKVVEKVLFLIVIIIMMMGHGAWRVFQPLDCSSHNLIHNCSKFILSLLNIALEKRVEIIIIIIIIIINNINSGVRWCDGHSPSRLRLESTHKSHIS